MKKLILLIMILMSIPILAQEKPRSSKSLIMFADRYGNLRDYSGLAFLDSDNKDMYVLGGKYTLGHTGAQVEAILDKMDSLTLPISSLNVFDDGLTTQILVGGGLNVVPVWGTNLPTAVTIGSAYIYRAGGTDVADGDVADTITITNISQVQDITATAAEINYTTGVTSNIQAQMDLKGTIVVDDSLASDIADLVISKQDTVLGISDAEIAFLDGLTDTVQQQLDLKAPLISPSFTTPALGVATGTSLDLTSSVRAPQINVDGVIVIDYIAPAMRFGSTASGDPVYMMVNSAIRARWTTTGTLTLGTVDSVGSLPLYVGSVVTGAPTDGNKGAGTMNAVAVYDDGVLLADYVFSKNYEDYTQFSIKQMKEYYLKEKHLPTIISWANDPDKRPSLGQLSSQLLETVEVQAKYIVELEERLSKLEQRLK